MHASGMSFRAVEQATGISHNAVINWFKQANLALSEAAESEENLENDSEETVAKMLKKLFKVKKKQQFYTSDKHLLLVAFVS